jgi:hypothetical protein
LKDLQAELLKLAASNADYEKVGNEIYRPALSSRSFCWKAPGGTSRKSASLT